MTYSRAEFNNVSMFEIFRMEVNKQVVLLNDNLLAIENQTDVSAGDSLECIEALMRSAHCVKGAARIVGLDLVVHVAHAMEDS